MSIERTRPPIMSDAIMYYPNARPKQFNAYAKQPNEAFIGLVDFKGRFDTQDKKLPQANKSNMTLQQKCYLHTGCGIGVDYRRAPLNHSYNSRKFGNEKPMLINYYHPKL